MAQNRPIKRLLVANRGEIAARIISAARDLSIPVYAVYTSNDISHTYHATQAIQLNSPASYLNIDELIQLVKAHEIDAVHPGYGFLSESAEFATRVWKEAGVMVIGPGWEVLERTGDKLAARRLAEECGVSALPALTDPTNDVTKVRSFAAHVGYPIMIKAVDGGGGRGIRLVTDESKLSSAMTRAVEESPSKQVFAEKAAVDGFRHVEIQIVGDAEGNVTHLWERECSIQRRYQKVVEMAPSSVTDRELVAEVIEAALRMAKKISYTSLGTFEFLLNPHTRSYYFLEINPRLQVEHTVSESICLTDIVIAQLQLAQGGTLSSTGLTNLNNGKTNPAQCPRLHSLQLRLTAEDPSKNWSLSMGKISSFHFPSGAGIRIDSALIHGSPFTVSADFDSLIAKLIITSSSWDGVVAKARRALEDVRIVGVATNLGMLRAICGHEDFVAGRCDTQWLEARQDELLAAVSGMRGPKDTVANFFSTEQTSGSGVNLAAGNVLFRRDDAWEIQLTPKGNGKEKKEGKKYHLQLQRVLRNDFPASLAADIRFTAPEAEPRDYTLALNSTSASSSSLSSQHRRGSPSDPSHVIIPFSGKLVEVLVDEGDCIEKGDMVCVVKQMKMELEVRSARAGKVSWVTEAEDGEDVAEGMLVAVVEGEGRVEAKL